MDKREKKKSMLSNAARVFGILMLMMGVIGFLGIARSDHLFGLVHLNAGHHIVHLCTGASAFLVSLMSNHASKAFFLIVGIFYGILSCLEFILEGRALFGFVANGDGDARLHMGIAAVSVFLGSLPENARDAEANVPTREDNKD